MLNFILIASSGQRVGKSYLATKLLELNLAQNHSGFAIPIKSQSFRIYTSFSNEINSDLINSHEFYQTKKDDKIFFNDRSPRDFVCAYSDLIQDFLGSEIRGQVTYNEASTKFNKCRQYTDLQSYTTILDDWRRTIESDFLSRQPNVNLLTIYLDKETDEIVSKPSNGSSHYEGAIDPKTCDIYFKYKSDYSNFNELLQLITTHVNQFKTND